VGQPDAHFAVLDARGDGVGRTGVDARNDAPKSSPVDAYVEAPVAVILDAHVDAPVSVVIDAAADVRSDATVDARPDTTLDAHADALDDVGADALRDATIDSTVDAVRDASTDASVDARPDTAHDATADQSTLPTLIAPRQLSPLSTSRVTRRTPTLRWLLPPGVADVTLDLCSDRGCTQPIGTSVHVTGSSYAPTTMLPIGVVFWRLHPSTMTDVTSATWQFTVGAGNAPVDTSWGTTLDVNGDGYADLAVGSLSGNLNDGSGTVYLYSGSAAGFASTPAMTLTDPRNGSGESFGWYVWGAGDVNGDGFADLAVSSPSPRTGPGYPTTDVYVYFGGASGLAASPSITLLAPPVTVPTGPASENLSTFGGRIASAGDLNGDGYGDIAITGGDDATYVYLGSPAGVASSPAATLNVSDNEDGGFYVPTGAIEQAFITSGDIDGDGYTDVVIGAEFTFGGPVAYIYVFAGGPNGVSSVPRSKGAIPFAFTNTDPLFSVDVESLSTGDFNGDGYADVLVSAYSGFGGGGTNFTSYVFVGSAAGISSAPATTHADTAEDDWIPAGDVNGDGYVDVVSGLALYLGSAEGLPSMPSSTLSLPPGMGLGAVASLGDVTDTGFPTLVFAAVAGGIESLYVYGGGPSGVPATPTTVLTNALPGTQFGRSIVGATY